MEVLAPASLPPCWQGRCPYHHTTSQHCTPRQVLNRQLVGGAAQTSVLITQHPSLHASRPRGAAQFGWPPGGRGPRGWPGHSHHLEAEGWDGPAAELPAVPLPVTGGGYAPGACELHE